MMRETGVVKTALAPTSPLSAVKAKTYFPTSVSVALALWGWQFVLHVWQPVSSGDMRLWLPHGIAWLHDALALGIVAIVGSRLGRYGWWLLAVAGALLSIYPQLLRQYLAMQTNLFASDMSAASTFLTSYLGLQRLWPAVVAVAVAGAAGCCLRPLRASKAALVAIGISIAAALLTLPRSPNPLLSSAWQQTSALLSGETRVVPSLQSVAASQVANIVKTRPRLFGQVAYRHVFLIVLEGITSTDFERDFIDRGDGYYSRVKDEAIYFSNYRSTNLDSYTSLIAMLNGRQVPYRAYAEPSSYEHINFGNNLTDTLRKNGYHGMFLSTYRHQPFVPTRDDWDVVLDGEDLDIGNQWLSLGNSRMEQAVEDKAAIATLVDSARQHERSFILHEMVYGHSSEWQARTGKTPSVYADEYLGELTQQLASKDLLKDSLIVVVSDHGDRAKMADPENYRVPLLAIGNTIKSAKNPQLYSHLDLSAMIEGWIAQEPLPESRTSVDIVGSTERWVYGRLTDTGGYLFIDNARGSIMNASGSIDPVALQRDFQEKLVELGAVDNRIRQ